MFTTDYTVDLRHFRRGFLSPSRSSPDTVPVQLDWLVARRTHFTSIIFVYAHHGTVFTKFLFQPQNRSCRMATSKPWSLGEITEPNQRLHTLPAYYATTDTHQGLLLVFWGHRYSSLPLLRCTIVNNAPTALLSRMCMDRDVNASRNILELLTRQYKRLERPDCFKRSKNDGDTSMTSPDPTGEVEW